MKYTCYLWLHDLEKKRFSFWPTGVQYSRFRLQVVGTLQTMKPFFGDFLFMFGASIAWPQLFVFKPPAEPVLHRIYPSIGRCTLAFATKCLWIYYVTVQRRLRRQDEKYRLQTSLIGKWSRRRFLSRMHKQRIEHLTKWNKVKSSRWHSRIESEMILILMHVQLPLFFIDPLICDLAALSSR